MKIKALIVFIGLVIAVLIVQQRSDRPTPGASPQPTPPLEQIEVSPSPSAQVVSLTATQSGQTALELLEANANVKTQEFDFGVMIQSINGLAADDSHFWGLYVNGEFAQTGASETILEEGDIIEWRYEEFDSSL